MQPNQSQTFWFSLLLAGAVALAMSSAVARAAATHSDHVHASLVADTLSIQPGKPFMVGMRLKIDPGWHVYWRNPGDSGAATRLKLTLPPGWTAGPVLYPVPERLVQQSGGSSLTVYCYTDEVMLMASVTPPRQIADGSAVTVAATGNWCVCSDICILGKAQMWLTTHVRSTDTPAPDNAELFKTWKSRLPLSVDQALSDIQVTNVAATPIGPQQLKINATWRKTLGASVLNWMPAPSDDLNVSAAYLAVSDASSTTALNIQPITGITPTSQPIAGLLAYQDVQGVWHGVSITIARDTFAVLDKDGISASASEGN